MNDDLKIMLGAQTQLWEVIMSYPEKDRLKVAGVALKVTIQLYQTMLDTEALEKVFEYVEKPNTTDKTVDNHEDRLRILETMAHPKRDFVVCNNCKQPIEQCEE